jgi:hypothetical protein
MKVGIVGHGADKFTAAGRGRARDVIVEILRRAGPGTIIVSGHSPMGGIDLWTEELAEAHGLSLDIKAPRQQSWSGTYAYQARNRKIAAVADILYIVVADTYPPGYRGRTFPLCYHCARHGADGRTHVKSGGCWTGWQAKILGKDAHSIVVRNSSRKGPGPEEGR